MTPEQLQALTLEHEPSSVRNAARRALDGEEWAIDYCRKLLQQRAERCPACRDRLPYDSGKHTFERGRCGFLSPADVAARERRRCERLEQNERNRDFYLRDYDHPYYDTTDERDGNK